MAEASSSQTEGDIRNMLNMLEAVDGEAKAVAGSFCSLLNSVKSALSQVTGSTIEHISCYNEAAGELQNSAIDAASKGNRFINSCLRINEEMKGIDNLAAQLKHLRQVVEQLEQQVNRHFSRA